MDKEFAGELIKKVLPSYEIREMLGEGSFGVVFRITDSLKERAVKIVQLSASPSIEKGTVTSANKKIERDFRHIVESYERIECDEIVTVYDFHKVFGGQSRRQAMAYAIVVMEIYPSNLLDYVIDSYEKHNRPLDIKTASSLVEKLARLIGDLYTKRGFLFEDLKPENILVKGQGGDLKVVVGDIGGLKSLGSVTATGSQVTLSYSAAEVIRRGQKPDLRSIIYSFGLISFFLLEGHLPYEDYGVSERIDLIKDRGIFFERRDIPDNLKRVLERCLAFEPEDRYEDFTEVIEAIRGKEDRVIDKFSEDTIDLESFLKTTPQAPGSPESGGTVRKTVSPADILNRTRPAGPQKMFARTQRSVPETKRRLETIRISEEISDIDRVTKEIRNLVIKSGDLYKIQNESYKIYNDIRIEKGALLVIENAKLYFDENGGIISMGTLRAKNSVFGAIDFSRKWKNIALCPSDTRVSYISGCKFRFGKGRTWKSIKNKFGTGTYSLNDNYLYGGALFIAGAKEKIVTVNDSAFYGCSAQEGGGVFSLKSEPTIENCTIDNCSAGLCGGGISCVESNPVIRNCRLKGCAAHKEGGGMFCLASHPAIDGCTFEGCSTRYLYGGGIYCSGSNPVIKNCKFDRCAATKDGGGIYCDDKSRPKIMYPAFTNCEPNNTNYDPNAPQNRRRSRFFSK